MKKQNLLTTLILVTTVLSGTAKAFGYAEVEQTINLSVQPSVSIEKTSSNESGTISPKTGVHNGLSASFKIQSNGTDDDYDFIVGSKITSMDGEVSAYSNSGGIMFANTTVLPTATAVENARTGGKDNANVIVYPLTNTVTDPMSVIFDETKSTDEGVGCYVVKISTASEGTLTQTVGGTPVANSYSVGGDQAGTYKATVYFTAVSK